MVGTLPILAMIPATDKLPPWTFYSGISKVQQMMKWVHQQASIPFELENLPHLSEVDKQRYKDQVREREVALDKKREEEKKAMQDEERAQAELKRRKRKQLKEKELQKEKEQNQLAPAEAKEEPGLVEEATAIADAAKSARLSAILADHDEF